MAIAVIIRPSGSGYIWTYPSARKRRSEKLSLIFSRFSTRWRPKLEFRVLFCWVVKPKPQQSRRLTRERRKLSERANERSKSRETRVTIGMAYSFLPKLNFESVHCLTFISVVDKHCFFFWSHKGPLSGPYWSIWTREFDTTLWSAPHERSLLWRNRLSSTFTAVLFRRYSTG